MESRWMSKFSHKRLLLKQLAGVGAGCLASSLSAAANAQAGAAVQKVVIPVFMRMDDPRLEARRLERAYLGHASGSAIDGLQVATKDSSFELDVARIDLQFSAVRVSSIEQVRAEAVKLTQAGAPLFVSELASSWLGTLCDATKGAVFNVSEAHDELREQQCRGNLFHVYPSERMKADGLAQILMARRWSKVFLLVGDTPEDVRRSAVVINTLKRFNLKVIANKTFKLSADPRERQLSNLSLLTGGQDFDVLWVVDSDGEFARTVPYRLPLPRPVVGDAGLVPLAWDSHFDRYGAPQVSKSFAKNLRRPMTGHDWAAWMAGRVLVSALTQLTDVKSSDTKKKLQSSDFLKLLGSAEFKVDGSKGQVLSFRSWDRQLRQPIWLSDGQAVVDTAPLEGVMHPRNALDTLGADAPEKLCKAVS
jgi:ABC transporter substrate binding protein (PQQ-dependent alcohol dehydrogenase system)